MTVERQLKLTPGLLTREAAAAAHDPPRSFSAFSLTPLERPEGEQTVSIVYFAVGCKTCGHDAFHLGAHPTSAPQSWAKPDEQILRPPHRLRCAGCGQTNMLFNPHTDGYNGILCGGSDAAPGGAEEAFAPTPLETYVAATYNIWLGELEELAAEAGAPVKATDLFDWINIIQSTPEKDFHTELDYSCA